MADHSLNAVMEYTVYSLRTTLDENVIKMPEPSEGGREEGG